MTRYDNVFHSEDPRMIFGVILLSTYRINENHEAFILSYQNSAILPFMFSKIECFLEGLRALAIF